MTETASAIEILRVPSLATRHYRDTLLGTDPRANPATGTAIEVEQMSSPVSLLNRISLLGKPQRVGSMEEMTDTCQVRDRYIERGLRLTNNRSHRLLPVRLNRPVVNTPPSSRHIRQPVSKQNRRDSSHIPVGTSDISRPVRLVATLSNKIETAFSPCRLDPSIRDTTRQNYRSLSPDWS